MSEPRWPSVSMILRATGLSDYSEVPPDILERARMRGIEVHAWAELLALGHWKLEEPGPEDEHRGYVEAVASFMSDTGFVPDLIEKRFRCKAYKFTGRVDWSGPLHGERLILDLKCAADIRPEVAIQLGAYELGMRAEDPARFAGKVKRAALQLRKDGTYKLQMFDDKRDLQRFLAALEICNLKMAWGRV